MATVANENKNDALTGPEISARYGTIRYEGTVMFGGIRTIAPEENCRPVRVIVWVRISVSFGGQFSSGALVLEPCLACVCFVFKKLVFLSF